MKGKIGDPSRRKDVGEVKHASVRLVAGVAGVLALVASLVVAAVGTAGTAGNQAQTAAKYPAPKVPNAAAMK
jgi:hypothetical protein